MASQSETAYQHLRSAILSAGVLPGTHLGELEWSERLSVGRFAIREALKRLHGEGVVTRARGKYRVKVMTPEEVAETGHLRAVLEVGALRFRRVPLEPEEREALRGAAADYAEFVRKGYFEGAREADLRFHRAIVALSRNARLVTLYEESNLPLFQATIGPRPAELTDFDQAAREHLAVVAALEKDDLNRAARLLEAHLKRGEEAVIGYPSGTAPASRKSGGTGASKASHSPVRG